MSYNILLCASGIGQACCNIFAKLGAKVIVADLNEDAAKQTAAALSNPSNHSHFKVDVSCKDSVENLAANIENFYSKPPEVVINSAGWANKPLGFLEISDELFEKIQNVNVKGTFLINKVFLNRMIKAGYAKGAFVNISSIAKYGFPGLAAYSTSKAAVDGLTKSLAFEFGSQGFRFNAVAPGITKTPLIDSMVDEAFIRECSKSIALGRAALPEEIAQVCAFLASENSSYINGTTIDVNGGKF